MSSLKIFVVSLAVLLAGDALAASSYGKLPLTFERNVGQTDDAVHFVSRGQGYSIFLTGSEAVLRLSTPQGGSAVVRMQPVGGNGASRITGEAPLPTRSSYFVGDDAQRWRAGIPNFASVRYESVYAGIDLVFRGNQRQLEYDFVVAPHAAPERIRLAFEGAQSMSIGAAGELVLRTSGGNLVQPRPQVYQVIDGQRRAVEGDYELFGAHVGFRVGRYDRSAELIIDPLLVYSTFLGGAGLDEGLAIAVDIDGNAYVTGLVESLTFPGVSGSSLQTDNGGGYDAFVTKINSAGTGIVYSTFLGGNGGSEYGMGIAVDGSGNAYVTGATNSTNFPSATTAFAGGWRDAFVTKLDATGTSIVYSRLIGTADDDLGQGVAVDGNGNAYLTGGTGSKAFVTRLDALGNTVYSTYFGGSGVGVAVDAAENAYIGGSAGGDAFVAKVDAAGATVYFTVVAGNGGDETTGVAIDASGNAYLSGYTDSTTLSGITSSSIQPANGGGYDGFVSKLDATGAIAYSTFLGADNTDFISGGIAVDAAGNTWVAGATVSTTFPGIGDNSLQPMNGGGDADVFITQIDPTGTAIKYSTFFGGIGDDEAMGVAVDNANNVYVTGWTGSTNFPIGGVNAIQPAFGGGWLDGFVLKLVY